MAKRDFAALDRSNSDSLERSVVKLRKLESGKGVEVAGTSRHVHHLEGLPDELLLRILSFLDMDDLINSQRISRRIAVLAKDSQIWKRLYYERFVYRRFGRTIKQMATKDKTKKLFSSDNGSTAGIATRIGMDWKSKYRLSHKWSNGTCNRREITLASKILPQTFLCLRGSMAITADAECGLRAWRMRDEKQTFVTSTKLHINDDEKPDPQPSALSVEVYHSNPNKLNIAVGFISGDVGLYDFDIPQERFEQRQIIPCFEEQAVSSLAQAGQGYLLAMSRTQAMSLYQVRWIKRHDRHEKPRLISSLNSLSNWKPVSVTLRASKVSLMASIIYAYPRFITGWSVGLQELRWDPISHELLSTRLATSPHSASPSLASRPRLSARTEYLPPTTTKPTSLCYTHPYLLATHPDNTLSLYMVRSTESELSISPGMRLWGHTSDVYAANIGDRGKAVTVAYGGDVRVWELEEGLTSALARKATPGPLVSVRLQPLAAEKDIEPYLHPETHDLVLSSPEDTLPETAPASIDFDDERLVVLKSRGPEAQTMFVYDFT